MMEDLEEFKALDGRKFCFVNMDSDTMMKVWELGSKEGCKTGVLGGLDVRDVDIDTLEKLKVWEQLSDVVKSDIVNGTTSKTQKVREIMDKVRCGRKRKYPNLPTELTCISCGAVTKVVPSILAGRIESMKHKNALYTASDYIKTYTCKKCKGINSKSTAKEYPAELVCKCGNKVALNIPQLKKKAEKLNISMQEAIDTYKCQTCCPTKGRKKRTRNA